MKEEGVGFGFFTIWYVSHMSRDMVEVKIRRYIMWLFVEIGSGVFCQVMR